VSWGGPSHQGGETKPSPAGHRGGGNVGGTGLAVEDESVADKCPDDLSSHEAAESSIVNRHASDGDGHVRFLGDVNLPSWSVRYWLAVLDEAL